MDSHLNRVISLNVVLVDDNEEHLELLSLALQNAGADPCFEHIKVHTFRDPADALADMPAEGSVVVLCDYSLSGTSATEWLSDFIKVSDGPVIILTSHGNERVASEIFRSGASDYLVKSDVFDNSNRLHVSIREALRRHKLEQRNHGLSRQLKIANSELERKNKTLAELTDTAHRFVDNVAHEFRTPLAVIKEFASIMADGLGGEVSDKQSEFLQYIMDASRDLAMLVDDFLDSSRIKSRTLRVDRASHAVDSIIDAIRPGLRLRAESKGVTLVERLDTSLPEVFVDAEKVRRVITNLVINAIKFSPKNSEIVISAKQSGSDEVLIGVSDHGSGVSESEKNLIFDRFKQVGDVQSFDTKGFGLGLNIARELVWLNLGSMDVQSEQGKGATFLFSLPLCDHRALLSRYVDQVSLRDSRQMISMLRATGTKPDVDLEQIRSHLVSCCYPMDLILHEEQRSSLLLVGATNEPDKWIARLQRELAKRLEDEPRGTASPIRFQTLGSWAPKRAKDPILANAFRAFAGERVSA